MVRKKRVKKGESLKEKELKEKDKGFLGILFFLATLYISIVFGSYSIVKEVSSKIYLDWGISLSSDAFSLILLGIMLVVGFYLSVIIFVGILELVSYYSILNPTQLKVKRTLRQMVLNSPLEIVLVGLSLGVFLIMLLLVYFKTEFAVIMALFYMVSFIFLLFNFNKMGKFISSMTVKKPKPTCKKYLVLILMIFLVLSTIYLLFGIIIFNLARFDIHLDKEIYHTNESAYIIIFSNGIIKPIPYHITYSNLEIGLNYTYDLKYSLAPIYLKLDSLILTEHPYNSYIKIYYNFPDYYHKILFFRENITQSKFIPVIYS